PAAVRGWKLEAVKRAGGDPPVLEGAGYNEVYTAFAGYYFIFWRGFSDIFQPAMLFLCEILADHPRELMKKP
ncbi:MAG: hypothetical protein HFG03_12460, partial [Oscillibacter sp.]|nr:hypothetical protein [Oscillibacter sp.]